VNCFETLILEKKRLLQDYLQCLKEHCERFSPKNVETAAADPEQKLDWVDELTSERESKFRILQLLDIRINEEQANLTQPELDQIKGKVDFQEAVQQIIDLGGEIQLTDQSKARARHLPVKALTRKSKDKHDV